MKLKSFTVNNYRSITSAYKLPLGSLSILVGPNNEGKSNILRAIVTSLRLITEYSREGRRFGRYRRFQQDDLSYDWERDFPVSLQQEEPEAHSQFTLEFGLSEQDFADFREEIQVNLSSDLKLRVELGQQHVKIEPLMQGKAKRALITKASEIAQFVGRRVDVQYIPAIRTSAMALDVVESILSRELAVLEEEPAYQKLLEQVQKAQRPVLQKIEQELLSTVSSFVNEVKAISLETEGRVRSALRRSCRVLVDDGALTDLELKGDGIKSLTAISLARHVSQKALGRRSLILAIEEPESHLHPKAIHRLREVVQQMADSHQVILTTHSPALVDKKEISRNIIVRDGKGAPAESLAEVREVLGVELSDNLAGAYLVLLVEGEEDKRYLSSLLSELSVKLADAFSKGLLAIDCLGGASNLSYKIRLYRTLLCNVFAYLDNDADGRNAVEKAEREGLLSAPDSRLTGCLGMRDSEFEDLLNEGDYSDALRSRCAITLNPRFMGNLKKKWSDRVRLCAESQGKVWTEKFEARAKSVVCDAALQKGVAAINQHRRDSLDALVQDLELGLAKAGI